MSVGDEDEVADEGEYEVGDWDDVPRTYRPLDCTWGHGGITFFSAGLYGWPVGSLFRLLGYTRATVG